MLQLKIISLLIFLSILFITNYKLSENVWAEELSVIKDTRITPLAYDMRNSWKGTARPINANSTKILLNEYLAYNDGRGVVVADITDLKNAVNSNPDIWLSNYLAVTKPLNNTFLNYKCSFTYASRDVGCINRWGSQTVQWSRVSGEENIVYALYDSKKELVRINVDTGNTSIVGTYPSGMTYPQIMGWVEPNKIIINGNGNSYSSGYLMDLTNGITTYYSSPMKFDGVRCSEDLKLDAEIKKWDYTSIHTARSPNKNYVAHYSGTISEDGIWNNDCTSSIKPCNTPLYCSNCPADWLSGFGHNTTHVNWAYSDNWYIAGTAGDPYNVSGGSPYITTHEIYQINLSLDRETGQVSFKENLLISRKSAGLWYNGSNDLNYWALPSPSMSIDGKMIVYQSTDGKYSYDDNQVRGSSPWGTIGIFLVDVAPTSVSQTCTSFSYTAWSECQPNNTQTRTVISSSPAGCTGGTPVLEQSCTYKGTSLHSLLKATSTPVIDGNLGEYALAESLSFSPLSGGNTVTVRTLWDSEALYFGINVTDSQLNASVTTRDGSVWSEDAIEWFIDTYYDMGSPDPNSPYMRPDDYQGIVNIINGKYDSQGTVSGTPTSTWNGSWQSAVKLNGTNNNNSDTDSGYTIEIKIPWTSIGYSMPPSDDTIVGMSFAIDDKDSSSFSSLMWPNLLVANQNASNWQKVTLSGAFAVVDSTPPAPPIALMLK